jgi:hypothetical protein
MTRRRSSSTSRRKWLEPDKPIKERPAVEPEPVDLEHDRAVKAMMDRPARPRVVQLELLRVENDT